MTEIVLRFGMRASCIKPTVVSRYIILPDHVVNGTTAIFSYNKTVSCVLIFKMLKIYTIVYGDPGKIIFC